MVSGDTLLSMADLARLAEVGLPAVSNWRKRHADFPQAERVAGVERFEFRAVAAWLDGRRIPKNALRPAESPGTTYGDRFRRNSGSSVAGFQSTRPEPADPSDLDSAEYLWFSLDTDRRLFEIGSSLTSFAELILGLLYLKIRAPENWARLQAAGDARTVIRAVRAVRSADPGIRTLSDVRWSDHDAPLRVFHIVDRFRTPDRNDVRSIARLINDFLAMLSVIQRKTGDLTTPESLVRLIMQLAEPGPKDRIYDPFGRHGELLLGAAEHAHSEGSWPMALASDVATEHHLRITSLRAALLGIEVDLSWGMSVESGLDARADQCFELVVTNPPFNMRVAPRSHWAGDPRWRWGEPPQHNANFAWLQHVLAVLTPGGRAAVLMPNGASSSGDGAEQRIRRTMVESGAVETVVALPPNLFAATGIPVTLWMLRGSSEPSRTDVLFIDATHLGEMRDRIQRTLTAADIGQVADAYRSWRGRHSNYPYQPRQGLSRSVPLSEICTHGYTLNPRVYVTSSEPAGGMAHAPAKIAKLREELDDLRTLEASARKALDSRLARINFRLDFVSSEWQDISLGDTCEIMAGPATLKRGTLTDSSVPVVLPRNIRHGRIIDAQLDGVAADTAASMLRYRLAANDVVCTRAGELGRSGLVSPDQAGWLLGAGCIRLRPVPHVDPYYLMHCLRTPKARDWLDRNATGSTIPTISTRTLAQLPLLLPPMAAQQEIGALLGELDTAACAQERLSIITGELRDTLLPLLTNGLADPGPPS